MNTDPAVALIGQKEKDTQSWTLLEDNTYRLHDYDRAQCFWSFLPGIAGYDGVPAWAMYTNRGQVLSSFGSEDKDHAISEFLPATWATQLIGVQGFRTFIREQNQLFEPFGSRDLANGNPTRWLDIRPHEVSIHEENPATGLAVDVSYCGVTGSPVAAILRSVTITNLGMDSRELEVLDGLPLIVPAGVSDYSLKKLRRLIEALCRVREHNTGAILYATPTNTDDSASISLLEEASFYMAHHTTGDQSAELKPCRMVVDPDVVFGEDRDLVTPREFMNPLGFDPSKQHFQNRLPCAFAHLSASIPPGESIQIYALAGFSPSNEVFETFQAQYAGIANLKRISIEAERVVSELTEPGLAVSSEPVLDAYVRQNLLDNILRGGVPVMLPSRDGYRPVHVYCRRHGDMERDYNDFCLPGHPWSEGSGNFRDVLQNRRHDAWLYPAVGDWSIRTFVELIQADGYNPLSVKGWRWYSDEPAKVLDRAPECSNPAREELCGLLQEGFSPGSLLNWAVRYSIPADTGSDWVVDVLSNCSVRIEADADDAGCWIDHWTYLIDALEAYEGIYPDGIESLLFEEPFVQWFPISYKLPAPQEQRINTREGLRQVCCPSPVSDRKAGSLPSLPIFGKLLTLLLIKMVSLDPEGRGVEMDAGRPGWNDALNGLPGLFGSSTCELAEAVRLARWLRGALEKSPIGSTGIPEAATDLIAQCENLFAPNGWNYEQAVTARTEWKREIATSNGIDRVEVGKDRIDSLLRNFIKFAMESLDKARRDTDGLINTYYMRRHPKKDDGPGSPEDFIAEPLPLFLEGQVHLMRVLDTADETSAIHRAVKSSPLFDEKLSMYILNESLKKCPFEIGRARIFSPGIFENESVWPHMSYKYILELLRAGMFEEFHEEAKNSLVPFMDPGLYGRSILENSSYIVSSRNSETKLHGRGFVARLSGSTAEFIHIWNIMAFGERPFILENGELVFRVKPALPGEWFLGDGVERQIQWRCETETVTEHCLAAVFLGKTLVVYHNPQMKNTWNADSVKPRRIRGDGDLLSETGCLKGEAAEKLRKSSFRRLDIELA